MKLLLSLLCLQCIFIALSIQMNTNWVTSNEVLFTKVIPSPTNAADISVQYNSEYVPFISAANDEDLLYAMGNVLAENRLWQMEMIRRLTTGTLSEVFGEVTVALDITARRLQLLAVAKKNAQNSSPYYLHHVESYCKGINNFLQQAKQNKSLLPPEYEQYGAPFPADFEPAHAFLVAKIMAIGLSHNAASELANKRLYEQVGATRFEELTSYDDVLPTILPPYKHSNFTPQREVNNNDSKVQQLKKLINQITEEKLQSKKNPENFLDIFESKEDVTTAENEWNFILPTIKAAEEEYKFPTEPINDDFNADDAFDLQQLVNFLGMGDISHASNNWVVSGSLTKSGKPIISNDPHMPYILPSIWYLIGLDVTDPNSKWQEIVGATVVLAPGIGLGRTRNIAWAITSDPADTQDLFEMKNVNNNKQYVHNGRTLTYEMKQETFVIKGEASKTVDFYYSIYGPVIIDGSGNYYSLHWHALNETDTAIEAVIDSNTASNYAEWRSAMSKWWAMCWSTVYADVDGNIAVQLTGSIPIRPSSAAGSVPLGIIPTPGTGEYDWLGFIPFADMPHSFNPDQQFLVTANNLPGTSSQLKYFITGDSWAFGFRAQRIIDLIMDKTANNNKLTVDDMSDIQGDVLTLEFGYIYDSLKALEHVKDKFNNNKATKLFNELIKWDGDETTSSKVASGFEDWTHCLFNVSFYEIGNSQNNPFFIRNVFNNATLSGAGDDRACSYWNMTCLDYAARCFNNSAEKYPVNILRSYGTEHFALFFHLPPLPLKWNRFASVGGDKYTPRAASIALSLPGLSKIKAIIAGPSLRFINDLSTTTTNWISSPGQSGDPSSPSYSNMLSDWTKNDLIQLQPKNGNNNN